MTRDEWLRRCAARYEARAGVDSNQARELAEITLDAMIDASNPPGLPPADESAFLEDNSPEDEADAEMAEWTDDE